MSDSKFKVGDKCLDLQFGWATVEAIEDKIYVRFLKDKVGFSFRLDRKLSEAAFAPSLLTVEEAAKLGYFPPKKKVKKKLYAYFFQNDETEYSIRYTTLGDRQGQKLTMFGQDLVRAPALDTEIEVDEE